MSVQVFSLSDDGEAVPSQKSAKVQAPRAAVSMIEILDGIRNANMALTGTGELVFKVTFPKISGELTFTENEFLAIAARLRSLERVVISENASPGERALASMRFDDRGLVEMDLVHIQNKDKRSQIRGVTLSDNPVALAESLESLVSDAQATRLSKAEQIYKKLEITVPGYTPPAQTPATVSEEG